MKRLLTPLITALTLASFGVVRAEVVESGEQKIVDLSTGSDSFAGRRTAVSGDTLIFSINGKTTDGRPFSAVPIYKCISGIWTFHKYLFPPIAYDTHKFGAGLAISGDTIVVGAPGYEKAGITTGAAFVFWRDQDGPEQWGLAQEIHPSSGLAGDKFGEGVAVHGNTLAIGSTEDDSNGENAGAVYVYERASPTSLFAEVKKITGEPNPNAGGFIGSDLALQDDTLAIRAHLDDENGTDAGAVFIHERDLGGANHWGQKQKLKGESAGDWFGKSVAIQGSLLAVGAWTDDEKGFEAGSAYIFKQGVDGEWRLLTQLFAADPQPNSVFGASVAFLDGALAVGAQNDPTRGPFAGAVYLFQLEGCGPTPWAMVKKIATEQVESEDGFGVSVAGWGNNLVVGAQGDDDRGDSSGAVYSYQASVTERECEPEPSVTEYAIDEDTDLIVEAPGLLRKTRIIGLGDLPGGQYESTAWGISADGQVIVGGSDGAPQQVFRWSDTAGMIAVGGLTPPYVGSSSYAISDDLRVIVGNLGFAPGFGYSVGALWDLSGMRVLGLELFPEGTALTVANDVSGDGMIVVGYAGIGSYSIRSHPFMWREGSGVRMLRTLPNPINGAEALAISSDGSLIVGHSTTDGGYARAVYWSNGRVVALPGVTELNSAALGVSPNGRYIVGFTERFDGEWLREAFLWSKSEGKISLGDVEGGRTFSEAYGVSNDGSTAVGFGEGGTDSGAMIWTRNAGVHSLRKFLIAAGAENIGEWSRLHRANAISADGRRVVGYGTHMIPFAVGEAFLVEIGDYTPSATVELVEGVEHGILALNPDGSFAYTPAANYHGQDSFAYRVRNGAELSAVKFASILVRPVNDVPTGKPDSISVTVNKPATFAASKLAVNDTDADGDALTVTAVNAPAVAGSSVTLSAGTITYVPAANYAGSDSFTYEVRDGQGGVGHGIVNITVSPVHTISPTSMTLLANGKMLVRFVGKARTTYVVQANDGLGWFQIATATSSITGSFTITDPTPVIGRSYRAFIP